MIFAIIISEMETISAQVTDQSSNSTDGFWTNTVMNSQLWEVTLTELRATKAVRYKDREGHKICVITVNKCSSGERKPILNQVINNWTSQIHESNPANTEWKAISFQKAEQMLHPDLPEASKSVQMWACRLISADQRRLWSDSRNCEWIWVSILEN